MRSSLRRCVSLLRSLLHSPVARAPYRIAQQTALGIEYGMNLGGQTFFSKAIEAAPALPPIKAVPGALAASGLERSRCLLLPGKIHRIFGWNRRVSAGRRQPSRGKRTPTRARSVRMPPAIATTKHWNIIAVGDGAGTAELARVGSNYAVTRAR